MLLRRRRRQHACQVADLLGIGRVFIHPYACVLSAYGMGLADLRVLRQQAVEKPLDAGAGRASSSGSRERLGEAARTELRAQDVEDARIALEPRAHVRYAGTDTSLEVPLADADAMRAAFEAEHRDRYGFIVDGRGLVVEAVTVEGIGAMEEVAEPEHAAAARGTRSSRCAPRRCSPIARRTSRPSGSRRAVYTREALLPGDRITGPALIARRDHDGGGRARLGAGGDAARPPDPRPRRAAARARSRSARTATRFCSRSSTTCS